ncbi:protein-S-isoprenylcysteine O-methyltransferase [Scleromatobacter humisilvae]|uniref:Isoprenylcysteine carboxylmethyltransferase family protein n=1 Tax=Scleromatobacter humisilvae TaxID=2897159 RepID=A0A9X1YRB2_9BURK|nr:protein-S-isoprenylcysteine O-methyltransferase [Scleromatobacter humisilvae]MCK9687051.1 isoprenylcysteine carboxylmethyltransferase family protein [Scleromatobacter humisilvae]
MTPSISSFVFMAFTAAYLAIRGVFIRRARRQQKTDRGDLRDRLLIALVGIGQIVLPLLFVWTRALDFADRAQPSACVPLGVVAMAAGLCLFWRSHVDLGDNWSVTLEIDAKHALVTRGVYRLVRHPMYTSFFVSGLGQALLLANWIAGPAALVAVAVMLIVRVPNEEAMMIGEFGDEYRDYMRCTGGIVPRLS